MNAPKKYEERELLREAVKLLRTAETLVGQTMKMPATIELCLFAGKIGAVVDILKSVEMAGVPVHGPDEEAHPLEPADRTGDGDGD